MQCIVQWMGFLIFPFHIFNHYCEKPTTINILKYKKQKLLIPKFWSAEPKRGNYRWDKYLEKSLSYGAENLGVSFYYGYMLVVVESSQLDLAVLNYKNFILKNIVLHWKPQNFFQNSSISPILIKIFEKFYDSNWLIYKSTTYKNFIRTGQILIMNLIIFWTNKNQLFWQKVLKLKTQ